MADSRKLAPCHTWLADSMSKEVAATLQRIRRTQDVQHVAVMPDVHLAGSVCVGTVMATSELIYPEAIGGDIGCGIAAIAFDCQADTLLTERHARDVLDALNRCVPIHKRSRPINDPWLERATLRAGLLNRLKRRDGHLQLGTLGRGNHFLEFQRDEEDRLWLAVHSGSRAMGQAIRDWYVARCHGHSKGLAFLTANTQLGRDYLHDQGWARAYAERNRQCMMFAAAALLHQTFGAAFDFRTWIRTDHNHVQLERHFGSRLWVHRKGAAPAHRDRLSVIPGSMASPSYHVTGRGNVQSLQSSAHGAGRSLPRGLASRRISTEQLRKQMAGVWFDDSLAHRLRDEAPKAYRDIDAVMRAQQSLVKIVRTLRPILSYKGG